MKEIENIDTLSAFCRSNYTLKTKVAHITLSHSTPSQLTQKILLFIEYIQLISQILLIQSTITPSSSPDLNRFNATIFYTAQLCNPASFLSSSANSGQVVFVMIIALLFTILRYLLFIYVAYIAYRGQQGHVTLIRAWCWTYTCQTRALCYLCGSFYVQLVIYASNSLSFSRSTALALVTILAIMFVAEYMLAVAIETQLIYLLPNKNFLTSKNCHIQMLTLFQKFVLHLLQLCLQHQSSLNMWMISSVNMAISIAALYRYHTILPLYRFKALIMQSDLLSISAALNIAYIFSTLLYSFEYEANTASVTCLMWLITAVFTVQIFREYLRTTVCRLLTSNFRGDPNLLIHKVTATEELDKSVNIPRGSTSTYEWTYLLSMTQRSNIKQTFDLTRTIAPEWTIDMSDDEEAQTVFILYLERLSAQYRSNSLIKLHLANRYTKKPELFAKLLRTVESLRVTMWSTNHITAALLLLKAENKIRKNAQIHQIRGKQDILSPKFGTDLDIDSAQDLRVDLHAYTKNKVKMDGVRKDILKLVRLKIKVCSSMLTTTPDASYIYSSGQVIYSLKAALNTTVSLLPFAFPDSYIAPLLLCAEYYLIVNYSHSNNLRYKRLYRQRLSRHSAVFDSLTLSTHNLYQHDNALLILSAQGSDFGHIKYASTAIGTICGNTAASYMNVHSSILFPTILQPVYSTMFRQIFQANQDFFLNRRIRVYLIHKAGHLVEADIFLTVHPHLTKNLHLAMIIRPVPSTNEYLLVHENGDVEGATKKLGKMLGIRQSPNSSLQTVNLKRISPELDRANRYQTKLIRAQGAPTPTPSSQTNKPLAKIFNFHNDMCRTAESPNGMEVQGTSDEPQATTGSKSCNRTFRWDTQAIKLQDTPSKVSGKSGSDQLLTSVDFIGTPILLATSHQSTPSRPLNRDKSLDNTSSMTADGKNYLFSFDFALLRFGSTYMRLVTINLKTEYSTTVIKNRKMAIKKKIIADEGPKLGDCKEEDEIAEVSEDEDPISNFEENFSDVKILQNNPDSAMVAAGTVRRHTFVRTVPQMRTATMQSDLKTSDILLPPCSPDRLLLTSHRSKELITDASLVQAHKPSGVEAEDAYSKPLEATLNNAAAAKMSLASSLLATNQSTLSDTSSTTYKAFQLAIATRSTPNLFRTLCIIFYLIIVIALVGQVGLKVASDQTMNSLVDKKNLLNYVQLRSYYNNRVYLDVITIWLYEFTTLYIQLNSKLNKANVVSLMTGYLTELAMYNRKIIGLVEGLDDEAKHFIYQKDIRIFGDANGDNTNNYTNVTSFDVIDIYVNTINTWKSKKNASLADDYNFCIFLRKNMSQDFLIKSAQMYNFFLQLVEDGKIQFEIVMACCLMIPLVLLWLSMLLLAFIIRVQYVALRGNLLAFVHLKPEYIDSQLKNLQELERRVMNENSFTLEEPRYVAYMRKDHRQQQQQSNIYGLVKKHTTRVLNDTSLKRAYMWYLVKIAAYLITLLALTGGSYASVNKSLQVIYRRQSQLRLNDYINDKVYGSFISQGELYLSNNTALVGGILPLDALMQVVNDIQSIGTMLVSTFQEEDHTYDPAIKALVFDKYNCEGLEGINIYYCAQLVGRGQEANLMANVAAMGLSYQNAAKYYMMEDKSTAKAFSKLLVIEASVVTRWAPSVYDTLSGQTQLLQVIISQKLDQSISDASSDRNHLLMVFCIVLMVLSALIWVQILVRIKEGNNNFKKVLQLFPAEIILSSRLLQNFLKRTSPNLVNLMRMTE